MCYQCANVAVATHSPSSFASFGGWCCFSFFCVVFFFIVYFLRVHTWPAFSIVTHDSYTQTHRHNDMTVKFSLFADFTLTLCTFKRYPIRLFVASSLVNAWMDRNSAPFFLFKFIFSNLYNNLVHYSFMEINCGAKFQWVCPFFRSLRCDDCR